MTTHQHVVQIHIDASIHDEAAAVLAGMGLTVSDAVRILLTKIANEKSLPLTPNAVTVAAMEEARADKLAGFSSVDALMAHLHEKD